MLLTAKLIVLFVADNDIRRLAYLCENVQEEIKLELSYKQV